MSGGKLDAASYLDPSMHGLKSETASLLSNLSTDITNLVAKRGERAKEPVQSPDYRDDRNQKSYGGLE